MNSTAPSRAWSRPASSAASLPKLRDSVTHLHVERAGGQAAGDRQRVVARCRRRHRPTSIAKTAFGLERCARPRRCARAARRGLDRLVVERNHDRQAGAGRCPRRPVAVIARSPHRRTALVRRDYSAWALRCRARFHMGASSLTCYREPKRRSSRTFSTASARHGTSAPRAQGDVLRHGRRGQHRGRPCVFFGRRLLGWPLVRQRAGLADGDHRLRS